MSEETVIQMGNGGLWRPSSSRTYLICVKCNNEVDTPEEIRSYPDGQCPQCGSNWTRTESLNTVVQVTMPESIKGGTI